QSVLLVVGRRTRISSPFPYTTLFRSRGQSRASKAVQAAGVRTTATVIDHVAVEMREVGATANSQPVKDKHQYIIADFEYDPRRRSEEHTSELQSRENLVCRLLLEKKK